MRRSPTAARPTPSRTPTCLTGAGAAAFIDSPPSPLPNLAARPAATPTVDPTAGKDALPLSGLRVLDFTWWIAGPAATKQLAAHGAEVIKIESASHIDPVRPLEPFLPAIPGINSGGYFNNLNTDKLSVSLDMTTDEARRLVRDLVATRDVVFDNYAGFG
ncbi:MAG: CoA transferase [Dehalococcoidia bacterium]